MTVGTDYGDTDQGSEVEALRVLKSSGPISEQTYAKTVDDNPRALYRKSMILFPDHGSSSSVALLFDP